MSQMQKRWRRKIIYNMNDYIYLSCNLHDIRTNVEQADFIHYIWHSYASRALALGEGLPVIGRLLGHKEIATTARYAHLMREAEKAAAARVGESIGAHIVRSTEAA